MRPSSGERSAALVITVVGLIGATTMAIGVLRLGGADIDRQRGQRAAEQVALAAGRAMADSTASDPVGTVPGEVRTAAQRAAAAAHATLRSLRVRDQSSVDSVDGGVTALRITVSVTTAARSAPGVIVRTSSAVVVDVRDGPDRPTVRLVTP